MNQLIVKGSPKTISVGRAPFPENDSGEMKFTRKSPNTAAT